ncbi:MAG: amino acid ABC transporter permease [Chloroflexota bacterium]
MEHAQNASIKPPVTSLGVLGWLRANLFSNWFNSLLTILSLILIYFFGRSLVIWSVQEANWLAVTNNLGVLTWGRYPDTEVWRLGLSLALVVLMGVLTWVFWSRQENPRMRRALLVGWLLMPFALTILIRGITLPTFRTIVNNLGYYLVRPDVLIALDQTWRSNAALTLAGLLTGASWVIFRGRRSRILSILGALVILALMVPLGASSQPWIFGLLTPIAIPLLLTFGLCLFIGRAVGRSFANASGIARVLGAIWFVSLPLILVVLTTFEVGNEAVDPVEALMIVPPHIWSGILLTLSLSVVSIVASFPIGVLLALGRRSSLPVVKGFSILFIELVRGVPLITILFMAQVMLPLFLPLEANIDRVLRAMAGMTFFTAAYLAEIVRGGLQAVRHEQVEAARALGLNEFLVTSLVVLPQALRAVIPPIMGQFVSIFKDTSLVAIVGLLDVLAVGQSVIKAREYLGAVREIYLFAGLFYFVFSYAMSQASRRLEVRLGVVAKE